MKKVFVHALAPVLMLAVVTNVVAADFKWPVTPAESVLTEKMTLFIFHPGDEVIKAAGAGKVIFVGEVLVDKVGLTVLVRHKDGFYSVYGRLASSTVSIGDSVESGQQVATQQGDTPLYFELKGPDGLLNPLHHLGKVFDE